MSHLILLLTRFRNGYPTRGDCFDPQNFCPLLFVQHLVAVQFATVPKLMWEFFLTSLPEDVLADPLPPKGNIMVFCVKILPLHASDIGLRKYTSLFSWFRGLPQPSLTIRPPLSSKLNSPFYLFFLNGINFFSAHLVFLLM